MAHYLEKPNVDEDICRLTPWKVSSIISITANEDIDSLTFNWFDETIRIEAFCGKYTKGWPILVVAKAFFDSKAPIVKGKDYVVELSNIYKFKLKWTPLDKSVAIAYDWYTDDEEWEELVSCPLPFPDGWRVNNWDLAYYIKRATKGACDADEFQCNLRKFGYEINKLDNGITIPMFDAFGELVSPSYAPDYGIFRINYFGQNWAIWKLLFPFQKYRTWI